MSGSLLLEHKLLFFSVHIKRFFLVIYIRKHLFSFLYTYFPNHSSQSFSVIPLSLVSVFLLNHSSLLLFSIIFKIFLGDLSVILNIKFKNKFLFHCPPMGGPKNSGDPQGVHLGHVCIQSRYKKIDILCSIN